MSDQDALRPALPEHDDLVPYDGVGARCPKCGSTMVGCAYHRAHDPACRCDGVDRCREHLGRWCRWCGYEWPQRVIGEETVCAHRRVR